MSSESQPHCCQHIDKVAGSLLRTHPRERRGWLHRTPVTGFGGAVERHHPPTSISILTRKCRWGSGGFTLTKPRRCTCWVCPPLLFGEAIWEFSVACQNYGRHYDSVIITRQTGRVERQLKMAEVAWCRFARPLMIGVLRPSPYMGGSRGPPTAASVFSRVNKKPKTKWMRGGDRVVTSLGR